MTFVQVEVEGQLCVITLNRPEVRNAIHRPMAEELREAFLHFEADPELRVAVVTGAGGHFCAGADLRAVGDADLRNEVTPDGNGTGPLGPTRLALSKPVIAAVEGYAVAGGLELALFADLRVVAQDATFGVFCRRWGVPLIDGGTARLPQIVGLGRALDLILTGRAVGAAEAAAMGLATSVVEPGETLRAARDLAATIAAFPQACMRADRAATYAGLGLTLEDAIRSEGALGSVIVDLEGAAGAQRFADGAGRHGAADTSRNP